MLYLHPEFSSREAQIGGVGGLCMDSEFVRGSSHTLNPQSRWEHLYPTTHRVGENTYFRQLNTIVYYSSILGPNTISKYYIYILSPNPRS